MIISRTPLRISFCGGGSDLPSFYRDHGGAVVSMAIKRYVYLGMHEYFESDGYLLKYSQTENVRSVDDIEHRILKQVFTETGIRGVDFNSSADVPAGTGLGSSSAFTVGVLNLCNAYQGRYESRSRLAERACEIELDKLGEPIGKQDQYGCAMGGLNFIRFHPDDSVTVEAISLTQAKRQRLEASLSMFYLGGTRSASAILKEQSAASSSGGTAVDDLRAMVDQATELRTDLVRDVDVLGPYLHEGWQRKRRLTAGISNPLIDSAYQRVLDAGATGGKLLGAGGSGFLLVYTPGDSKAAVREAMKDYRCYDVELDAIGSTIIHSD